jgi:hypothetical protein
LFSDKWLDRVKALIMPVGDVALKETGTKVPNLNVDVDDRARSAVATATGASNIAAAESTPTSEST